MRDSNGVIHVTARPWDIAITFGYPPGGDKTISVDDVFPPSGCTLIFPTPPLPTHPPEQVLKAETFQYITKSDGIKTTYTNDDTLMQYESSVIVDPATVSYTNLFINGMIQPPITYKVFTGVLIIDSIPEKGVPITLQFIRILQTGQG
ncbi:DUF4183 domain-containing protein [Paenibacillus alvei]|uniref:DUF4183 domain-containing protein n=1 Tax=Paenibacillus alvei TaxID=44250 RepID=A0AAP6ZZ50_PAEAL|nr:DUF4183 domain-containing protein [Paenibacillus alvei]MCY9580521.1 DUF4183 domain-containing protein [Paenibacillus alvei]MCY9585005.1 DUF4183 domain-containing protein [Paenibacillus alvei]NOJ70827.1 DUF4183 domain-containing protein [Paenibacillus alvei]